MAAAAGKDAGAGKRRPHDTDLEPLLDLIWEGASLSKACRELGLDIPTTDKWLHDDEGRSQQYARACEGRAEFLQEDGLTVTRAAAVSKSVDGKKVDPAGARAYLDAIKWACGRMAPKKEPVQRIDLTARTRQMTDEEIATEIAALQAGTAEA